MSNLSNPDAIVAPETTHESKNCSSCRLRLYYTTVETKHGTTAALCKFCLPGFRTNCAFCLRQCFYDEICRRCYQLSRNPPAHKQQVFVNKREEVCSCCKERCVEACMGLAEGHTRCFAIVDRRGRPICEKCKPFDRQPAICFTCKLHFASSNDLHRHLRVNESHQLEKSRCEEQWALLERAKTIKK